MDEDKFIRKLAEYTSRLSMQRAGNPPTSDSLEQDFFQLREELITLMEELQVSLEQLRQQKEELLVTRQRVDAERRRYQELFEFAPDGYLETDLNGKILEANLVASQQLNVPPQFLAGKLVTTYVAAEDRPEIRRRLFELGRREPAATAIEKWEARLKPRDSEPFYAELTVGIMEARWVEPTAGRRSPRTLRWMIHDISERKLAQKVLDQANAGLEAKVNERTVELSEANQELRQIAKELEQKNHELQEFAFIASHDLQEPLRKVRAFADVLIARAQDPGASDYLERMRSASVRMQAMLDGLLEYARVTSQGRPMEPTDLNQVCRDVLNDLELRIAQNQAQVELEPLPTVHADPLQMYRLFQNLLANALKFHDPDRPPVVKITAQSNGDTVTLQVIDNGIGFEPEQLDRLFQPFVRLNGRSQYEGSGMGLAICRKIAERHGGSITAEGAANQGATFSVTLPTSHL